MPAPRRRTAGDARSADCRCARCWLARISCRTPREGRPWSRTGSVCPRCTTSRSMHTLSVSIRVFASMRRRRCGSTRTGSCWQASRPSMAGCSGFRAIGRIGRTAPSLSGDSHASGKDSDRWPETVDRVVVCHDICLLGRRLRYPSTVGRMCRSYWVCRATFSAILGRTARRRWSGARPGVHVYDPLGDKYQRRVLGYKFCGIFRKHGYKRRPDVYS